MWEVYFGLETTRRRWRMVSHLMEKRTLLAPRLLLGMLAVASSALIGGVVVGLVWRPAPADRLAAYGHVPDFTLIERSGRTITRSDLLGKVSVVDFFYTRCTDACPLQTAHLARLQAELFHVPNVQFVSITVDPDHDGSAVLAAYAARFQADPERWLFLTGPRAAIYRLAVEGFHLAAFASRQREPGLVSTWLGPERAWAHDEAVSPEILRLVHASRFALVDQQARIRGYFDGTDWNATKRLHADIWRVLGR